MAEVYEYPTAPAEDSPVSLGAGLSNQRAATDEDKLRLIRDTVEGQTAFGSELANFQRRLRIILNL